MTRKLAAIFTFSSYACGIVNASPMAQNSTILWSPCSSASSIAYSCGTLSVPLDYTDYSSNKTLNLSLVKVSATRQPSRGSILFNPGGPGETGTDFVADFANPLLIMTGGFYDLIGFDPRGTGNTLPVSCYDDDTDRIIAALRTPITTNTSDTALGTMWAAKQTLAENCCNNAREVGELVGTAFVARDMIQIVDALGEDGMLRYWGFSYGTLLGATVAAMFPGRADKIILDGVLNPTQYYEGRDIEELATSDASFAGFFSGCLSAPPGSCALARPNITTDQLEQKIIDLLQTVKHNPISISPIEQTTILDYGTLKAAIVTSLYAPSLWPSLALAFDGLLNGNSTAFTAFENANQGDLSSLNIVEVNAAIRCGDNSIRAKILKDVIPVVDALYNESFVLGDVESVVTLTCASWRMHAREIYQGGFSNITTKNPVLLIGNTYDPLTPFVSAQNASVGFPGSVVLQHNGYGHTSIAQPSLCTALAIRAYFVNGTLPSPGTVCEPDVKLFSNETIVDVLTPIANTKRALLVNDDETLLMAAKELSRRMSSWRGF